VTLVPASAAASQAVKLAAPAPTLGARVGRVDHSNVDRVEGVGVVGVDRRDGPLGHAVNDCKSSGSGEQHERLPVQVTGLEPIAVLELVYCSAGAEHHQRHEVGVRRVDVHVADHPIIPKFGFLTRLETHL